jgi:hypothetical protein
VGFKLRQLQMGTPLPRFDFNLAVAASAVPKLKHE